MECTRWTSKGLHNKMLYVISPKAKMDLDGLINFSYIG